MCSSDLPCFLGCLAFLHRHFPPQSPCSRPLRPCLRSQQHERRRIDAFELWCWRVNCGEKDQGDVSKEIVVGNACGGKPGSHGSKAILLSLRVVPSPTGLPSKRGPGALVPSQDSRTMTLSPTPLSRPARGAGTLIPSAQRLVWAAKQALGNAALGALFA